MRSLGSIIVTISGISLSLGKKENQLDEILIRNFQAEFFNNDCKIYCDKCKAKHNATKMPRIVQVPEVLVITLKRFEYDPNVFNFVKIDREIFYEEKEFGLPLQVSSVTVQMELFAVIVCIL